MPTSVTASRGPVSSKRVATSVTVLTGTSLNRYEKHAAFQFRACGRVEADQLAGRNVGIRGNEREECSPIISQYRNHVASSSWDDDVSVHERSRRTEELTPVTRKMLAVVVLVPRGVFI